MKLKVEDDNLTIIEEDIIRAKTINEYEIELEFTEEWNDLSKTIVYTNGTDVWQEPIIDNKSIIPSLPNYRDYAIGVVGTIIENDVIVKRKATNLVYHAITVSSAEYEQNQISEDILAKTYEKYLQLITKESIKIYGYLGNIKELSIQIENDRQEIESNKNLVQELADGVKDFSTAIQYPCFAVDDEMNLVIKHAERMKNLLFSLNEETGELEVSILNG